MNENTRQGKNIEALIELEILTAAVDNTTTSGNTTCKGYVVRTTVSRISARIAVGATNLLLLRFPVRFKKFKYTDANISKTSRKTDFIRFMSSATS
jgi:hypothetical protein